MKKKTTSQKEKFNFALVLGAKSIDIDSLEEITKRECKGKEFLGVAEGTGLVHCLYLGSRYRDSHFMRQPDFLDVVKYYRYSNTSEHPELPGNMCIIEFYARKK